LPATRLKSSGKTILTEIIHIEPDTKPEAIRLHLARLGSGQVAVILPHGWGELDSFPQLRLLQRQARLRDQQLALVTQDLPTRRSAQALGIPVFGNEAAIVGRSWRMANRLPDVDPKQPAMGLPEPPPWRKHTADGRSRAEAVAPIARPTLHRTRVKRIEAENRYRQPLPFWLRLAGYVLSGFALAAILGAFLYFILPAATITLVPGQQSIEAAVELTADPGLDAPDLQRGLLPARLIERYVDTSGTILTTGNRRAATLNARGSVVFTNQTNRTIRIPAGTIVSTSTGDRIDFRTLKDVDVPGPTGGRATATIEAVAPGPIGNVRANSISTVSGALRTQVLVTNPGATGGGDSELVRVVTQADRDQLYTHIFAQVETSAFDQVQSELREDEWIPKESVQAYVIDRIYDHFNDEPADELTLNLRVLIQAVAVSETSARTSAMSALERAVPEGAKLVADSISFYAAPEMTVENRRVRFSVVGRGNYVVPIDSRQVRSAVVGLSQEEAAQELQRQWLLARPPQFYQDPDWFGTLPRLTNRIQVRVELNEAVAGR
jgi:hypothetical protein